MNKEAIIERQANENLKLVNDNKDLQQRIDKAIELLEVEKINNVISILKGEGNE